MVSPRYIRDHVVSTACHEPWALAKSGIAMVLTEQIPAAIYDGGFGETGPVSLNIGNGGAGQSGLIKALADQFIKDSVATGASPFRVTWYTSDTAYTIKNLASGLIDVGITYIPIAEQLAINQGIALPKRYYLWRDHFMLVGPPSNPAKLDPNSDITTMFSAIHVAAQNPVSTPPVRFLSRFDKSATNLKESSLWIGIGEIPWAMGYSNWYHQYIAFPVQALTAAIHLQEYTLTDRGTYLSLSPELTAQTRIYKASTDDTNDPLLNPAHLLIGTNATNSVMAKAFAEWSIGPAAQKIISDFSRNGQILYSVAP